MPDGLDALGPGLLSWCALALALGGLVKGVLGVGIPLVAVPMMSLVIPPHHAALLVLLPIFPANWIQMREGGSLRAKMRRFWPITAGISAGTVAGGWWFTRTSPGTVQGVVGIIVAAFVVIRLTHPSFHVPRRIEAVAGGAVGTLAGLVAGMALLVGPLVVMYMSSLRLARDEFVGSISLIYLVTACVVVLSLAGFEQLSGPLLLASVGACVPVFVGMAIGARIRERLSQALFERLLDLLLIAIAASLLWRSLA